jgi:hypothetical protein
VDFEKRSFVGAPLTSRRSCARAAMTGSSSILSTTRATSGDTIVMQEMLHSLNELYNARRARLDAAAGHIPSSVWWVIGFLGVLIVGFTALAGMRNLWVHFVLLAGFTTAIVIVVALIVQLDYPFRGEISVSAEPFEHVLSEVGADRGASTPSGAAR